MTSTRQGDPAITPVRSDETSVLEKLGWLSSAMNYGWDAVERGAAFGFDGGEGVAGVEGLARDHHARIVARAREVADDHPEAVVERHRDAHPVGLGVVEDLAAEVPVVEDVAVRQGGALWGTGRTRGVLNIDRVVRRETRFPSRQDLHVDRTTLTEQGIPLIIDHDGVLEGGAPGTDVTENRPVVRRAEASREQEQSQS